MDDGIELPSIDEGNNDYGNAGEMDDDLLERTVSSAPGGCLSLDSVFIMEDGWINWPNGIEEFIPWTDMMTVSQLRYHIRRIRLMRTNLPTLLNVLAFVLLFISASLASVGYNRAVTEILPRNCDMDYYEGRAFAGTSAEKLARWGGLNYTDEADIGLFPQPVRDFYMNAFSVKNITDNYEWYLGPWALLPSRGAFCPITVGVNAVLYDARDGQEVEENGDVSQIGVINFCFRFNHEGNADMNTFRAIDASNKLFYDLETNVADGWTEFGINKNLLAVACVFTWLTVFIGYATVFTPGYAQTLEGIFFRKDKLFSRFRGQNTAAEAVDEEREIEHEVDMERAAAKEAEERNTPSKRRSTLQDLQDAMMGVRRSVLSIDDSGRLGTQGELTGIYGKMKKNSDGVTGDGKERYLYDDAYATFINKASTAHSLAMVTLFVAAPLGIIALVRIFNSPFVQPEAFQSMFPSCEMEVRILHAEYNGEHGMNMIMYCTILNCVIWIWHCIMHYFFHNPAGPVKEVFQMPDLKHYKDHYTPEQRAEFRRADRDWGKEKGRRVARWVDKDDDYKNFASEQCKKIPEDDYVPPPIWQSAATKDKLQFGFRQPSRVFSITALG